MRQFLRLDDIDMNRKAMLVENQEALKRMEKSVRLADGHYEIGMLWKSDTPLASKQQANGRSKIAVLEEKAST